MTSDLAKAIVLQIEQDAVRELVASGREHLLEVWADNGYELVNSGTGWLDFMVGGQLVSRHRLDPNVEDLANAN